MASPPLLLLQDIDLTYGVKPLLNGATLSVGEGEMLALVGRNGSGKSTLLKIAAGLVEPDGGKSFLQPTATIRYLPQAPDISGHATTAAFVEDGLPPSDDPHRAQIWLEEMGLTGRESTAHLSGGEARRAALARVLAAAPDILLLDEPTNHLDLLAIERLEQALKASRSAIVMISHDRRFLENLSKSTVWLDRGTTRRLERGFAHFEEWRDQVLEEEEQGRHKLNRKIVQEEHWLRYGVSGRRKRNQRRLEDLRALRRQRDQLRRNKSGTEMKLEVQDAMETGKRVVEAHRVSKSYGDRKIVDDFSIKIVRGDRVGIVGPNGAGKTTLINLITGGQAPDAGTVKLGTNLEVATLDQNREKLDVDRSLAATLTGGRGDSVIINGRSRHVVGYMKDFLFKPEQAQTPIKALSGGELGRAMLAVALSHPSNLLVLDEPTNDLDLETLDLLQEMLANYPGTVILVSHDRDFLDRTVTSVVAYEGEGQWIEYAGGYTDMVAQRGYGMEKAEAHATPVSAPPKKMLAGEAGAGTPSKKSKNEPKPERRRLSPKEQHALKVLPDQMEALHKEIGKLEEALADPDFYIRDVETFTASTKRLAAAQAELEQAEEEWLRLELLREEIGA
ncbi:ABC transporter ATP-binding protein uup [Methyloligella halotolerans]|uniref:ABC transporter ATP-binding protein uup n=1 Tax=Methyloligella halotolerans TaxID=1177755 RepID=A0A1E2RYK4_9HYPH|nr:ATP-binding cassette domain-containing protein [Methyloligella halotolerans]ODA67129.1 ABC transporter ATP-binding protein uup [Methyloligella halotolerans]